MYMHTYNWKEITCNRSKLDFLKSIFLNIIFKGFKEKNIDFLKIVDWSIMFYNQYWIFEYNSLVICNKIILYT